MFLEHPAQVQWLAPCSCLPASHASTLPYQWFLWTIFLILMFATSEMEISVFLGNVMCGDNEWTSLLSCLPGMQPWARRERSFASSLVNTAVHTHERKNKKKERTHTYMKEETEHAYSVSQVFEREKKKRCFTSVASNASSTSDLEQGK